MSAISGVVCDVADCRATFLGGTGDGLDVTSVREDSHDDGWVSVYSQRGAYPRDLCPEHAL